MSDNDIHTRLANSHIRVAGIWPLSGLTYDPPDNFVDAAEFTRLPSPFAELWTRMGASHGDEVDWEALIGEALCEGISGFFGVAHCPRFTATGGGGCSFSWGHYRYDLFFSGDLDTLLDAMIAWGQSEWDEAVGGVR